MEEEKKYESKVMTLFDAEANQGTGSNRLDAIYAQLQELQMYKDEIMDDLNEFMSEIETKSIV